MLNFETRRGNPQDRNGFEAKVINVGLVSLCIEPCLVHLSWYAGRVRVMSLGVNEVFL